ncbi:unnamed protein product [Amaranthus hypochondriacus]
MYLKPKVFMFLLVIAFIHGSIRCNAKHKLNVQMINTLQGREDLTIHCKSKDNDLGVHVISFNGTYGFQFKPSFFGGTLYYCGFTWDESLHWFDIYVQSRDRDCTNVCPWYIYESGPCYLYDDQTTKCYQWNKNITL